MKLPATEVTIAKQKEDNMDAFTFIVVLAGATSIGCGLMRIIEWLDK